jgi:hypothetical protein
VRWLVAGAAAPDSLVFAFSGHGSLDATAAAHVHGTARDGILPCDHARAGPICDSELHGALVAPLPAGARLHCFVDACRGVFALGLPSCVYTRADGWSNWEVCIAAERAVPAQCPPISGCQPPAVVTGMDALTSVERSPVGWPMQALMAVQME